MLRENPRKVRLTSKLWWLFPAFFIGVGIILRCWNFSSLPFTHDELSAWYRLGYSSIGEVIERGVMIDFHPALTQIFLYFWTNLFGTGETVMKFPFLIMGIAVLPLVFTISKRAFGFTNAVLTTTFIACSQLFIQYSTIARPYMMGLILALILAFIWLNLIEGKRNWFWFIAFGVTAALCAFTHYFCTLLAGLIWLSAWFFVHKQQRIPLFMAGVIALVCFAPHLPITLHHLSKGGVGGSEGWLSPPDSEFIPGYFSFLSNHEPWIWILVLTPAILTLLKGNRRFTRVRAHFIMWFLISLCIGFVYSLYVNPILRFPVLIFSTPFLIIGITGTIKPPSGLWKILPLLIMIALIYGLIDQKYYHTINSQPYSTVAEKLKSLSGKHKKQVTASISLNPDYLGYYTDVYSLGFPVVWGYDRPAEEVYTQTNHCIDSLNPDIFYTDMGFPTNFSMIRTEYPQIINRTSGEGFDSFVLSREGESVISTDTLIHRSSIAKNDDREFINLGEMELDSLPVRYYDYISAGVSVSSEEEILLVVDFYRNDQRILWRSMSTEDLTQDRSKNIRLPFALNLWDHFKDQGDLNNVVLKMYLWNRQKGEVSASEFALERIPGNALFYNLLSPYPGVDGD